MFKHFFLLSFLGIFALHAQDKAAHVAFDDLTELIAGSSPYAGIIRAEKDMTKTQRDKELQWSNPEINFEREQVGEAPTKETESSLYISKEFQLPWIYLKNRHIWQLRMDAAETEKQQNLNQLLAEARTKYTRLVLLKTLTDQQLNIKSILDQLSQTIKAQEEEGAISAIDRSLLNMAIFSLEADVLHIQDEYRQSKTKLKQILGFAKDQEMVLVSTIGFKEFGTDLPENFQENHPGLKTRQLLLQAQDQLISLEKRAVLPSFSIEGGYKEVTPGDKGYILGISVPIPLLNRNRAAVNEQKITKYIQESEFDLYKYRLYTLINNRLMNIRANQTLLKKYQRDLQNFKLVEDLTISYQEGHLPLTEYLNAIQLFRESGKQYSEHLAAYFGEIFELETLYGRQLVTF